MTPARPVDFAGQWRLGATDPLPGGQMVPLPRVKLSVVAPLEAIPVETQSGTPLGVLLGLPLDWKAGQPIKHRMILPAPSTDDVDNWVERHIYRLGGSFLFVLDDGTGPERLYLDAGGSLSAVHDPATGQAGATTPALLDDAALTARFDEALYTHLDLAHEGWFTGTLTAHEGVKRLLPNHHLDLSTMKVTRHWPLAPVAETSDPDVAITRIVDAARGSLTAALAAGTASAGLTAGTETRFMLAMARDHLEALDFVTVRAKGAERDAWCAAKLAKRFDLRHRFLPVVTGDAADEADWHARAGYCVGGAHASTRRTIIPLKARDFLLGGQAGEVGRGFYWRPEDRADSAIDPAGLEARFGMPPHPAIRSEFADWLTGMAGFDAFQILDLAYLELRVGSWAFGLAYCDPAPRDLSPMVSRVSFEAMLSLPADWRRDKEKMIREAIGQTWPELLELPFNSYGDYRDKLALATRAIRNPHLILKKLRKLRG